MNFFVSSVKAKCPKCHKGNIFAYQNPYKNLNNIHVINPKCSHCEQDFLIEPGFYWGALYLSYILNVLLGGLFFILYAAFMWGSIIEYGNYFLVGVFCFILLLTPAMLRFSRSFWLHAWLKIEKSSGMFQE